MEAEAEASPSQLGACRAWRVGCRLVLLVAAVGDQGREVVPVGSQADSVSSGKGIALPRKSWHLQACVTLHMESGISVRAESVKSLDALSALVDGHIDYELGAVDVAPSRCELREIGRTMVMKRNCRGTMQHDMQPCMV